MVKSGGRFSCLRRELPGLDAQHLGLFLLGGGRRAFRLFYYLAMLALFPSYVLADEAYVPGVLPVLKKHKAEVLVADYQAKP